jgi:GT2 family glycosyltransferase
VPTYNGRDSLPKTLGALGRQTFPAERYEVVVVVDGSEDGTLELLAALEPSFELRTVWQENRGRAAAINAGLAAAHGEVVVLLDDDLEPARTFLAEHARAHGDGRPRGVVGVVRFRLDGSTPPFARYWGWRFEHFLARIGALGPELPWSSTYTGAFSARLEDLVAVGGFDESFDGYGLEDYELALRLSRAGVELRLCPDAVALHGYAKSFPQAAWDARERGGSAVTFKRLHPDVDPREFEPIDAAPPSILRRFVRYVLPEVSRVLPFVPQLVVQAVETAENHRASRLDYIYTLGLEYFFFLGRLEASRHGRPTAGRARR